MGRFEPERLSMEVNPPVSSALPDIWIDKVNERRPPKMIVLDMERSIASTRSNLESSTYNGHFGNRGDIISVTVAIM